MSLRTALWLSVALSCNLSMIGCGGPKSALALHDRNTPIPEIYDKQGQKFEGFEGYANGYVADQVKRCDAILDRLDRMQDKK